jgi:secreted Zn-dependent insulinase-like peptidase
LYFDVTSSSHSIDDIHKAIFAFVDAVPSLIHALSPEVYQNHVNTQINQKSRADPSLYDAAAFNWYEITEGKVDFALRAKQADFLKNSNSHLLQQQGLEQFAIDLLKSARRLLVVHAELPSTAPPSKSPAQSITFGSLCPDVEVKHVKSASEVHSLGSIVIPLSY